MPCGAGDDHSPREQYAFPQSLPDDPRQVRARVRAFFHATDASETRTEHEYRALATIPGVRAADAPGTAGRDAIALYLYQEGPAPARACAGDAPRPVTRLYSGCRYLEGRGDHHRRPPHDPGRGR
ncbi:hypothetical protein [Streptomyces glaucescens]|uniref:hypothetical protein n=1 Tax=Streptomyces glaucescens TaxID=1907 RepID=UPI000A372496|nr:hypothetical protein [Streptomyces glaucescens]